MAAVAAGAGMMQVRRRRAEEAELWAEAQRTDLPPVPAPFAEPEPSAEPVPDTWPEQLTKPAPGAQSEQLTQPDPDAEPVFDVEVTPEPTSTPRTQPEIEVASEAVRDLLALPAEVRPHDPSYGEVV